MIKPWIQHVMARCKRPSVYVSKTPVWDAAVDKTFPKGNPVKAKSRHGITLVHRPRRRWSSSRNHEPLNSAVWSLRSSDRAFSAARSTVVSHLLFYVYLPLFLSGLSTHACQVTAKGWVNFGPFCRDLTNSREEIPMALVDAISLTFSLIRICIILLWLTLILMLRPMPRSFQTFRCFQREDARCAWHGEARNQDWNLRRIADCAATWLLHTRLQATEDSTLELAGVVVDESPALPTTRRCSSSLGVHGRQDFEIRTSFRPGSGSVRPIADSHR